MCFKHLESEDVSISTSPNGKSSKAAEPCNSLAKRKRNGVHSSFPGDNFESSKTYWPKMMFEISKRDDCPETFGDLENADYMLSFNCFLKFYAANLREALQKWKSIATETHVTFFALDSYSKIKTSVRVNNELKVTVALDGREMDPPDLTWIIPVSRRINRWSQLKILLKHFSNRVLMGYEVLSGIDDVVAL